MRNLYRLEGFAKDSETLEEMVVYRALYGEGGLWVRPAKMFFETVERDALDAISLTGGVLIFCVGWNARKEDPRGEPAAVAGRRHRVDARQRRVVNRIRE